MPVNRNPNENDQFWMNCTPAGQACKDSQNSFESELEDLGVVVSDPGDER